MKKWPRPGTKAYEMRTRALIDAGWYSLDMKWRHNLSDKEREKVRQEYFEKRYKELTMPKPEEARKTRDSAVNAALVEIDDMKKRWQAWDQDPNLSRYDKRRKKEADRQKVAGHVTGLLNSARKGHTQLEASLKHDLTEAATNRNRRWTNPENRALLDQAEREVNSILSGSSSTLAGEDKTAALRKRWLEVNELEAGDKEYRSAMATVLAPKFDEMQSKWGLGAGDQRAGQRLSSTKNEVAQFLEAEDQPIQELRSAVDALDREWAEIQRHELGVNDALKELPDLGPSEAELRRAEVTEAAMRAAAEGR